MLYHLTGKTGFLGKILGSSPKFVSLDDRYIQFSEGKNIVEIHFADIKDCRLFVNKRPQAVAIKTHIVRDNETFILEILDRNKSYQIDSQWFEQIKFVEFLRIFQKKYVEESMTFAEKVQAIHAKCDQNMIKDQQLEKDLIDNLAKVYPTVYQPFSIDKKSRDTQEILKNPNIIFSHLSKENYYYYYLRNNFKREASRENIAIVENLLESTQKNLKIVKMRMESYKNVQQKLAQLKKEQQQKEQLKQAANRLSSLQAQNLQQNTQNTDLEFDSEVLGQLDELTSQISQIDTLEKSLFLNENLSIFSQNLDSDDEILKEINRKLKL